MERLTMTSDKGGVAFTFDLDITCRPSEAQKILKLAEHLKEYEDLEEQGLLLKLPCKVGDTVCVDSSLLPIEDMECYEDVDNPIPKFFLGRVISFRFAKRNWVKIAVKAKWLFEWVDEETGPDAKYIDSEKNFSFTLSAIGKTVFLTQEQAEKNLSCKE